MSPLAGLFTAGPAGGTGNVGTLAAPVAKAQWTATPRVVPLPPQLFSHNDQQVQWQSSVPDQPFKTGWGGRMVDLVDSLNNNPEISMSVSLDSFNNFEVGSSVTQFSVNPGGVITFTGSTGRA